MTSASELFYSRRSRFRRSYGDLFDSTHHYNDHRHRHRQSTANNRRDPLCRTSHLSHHSERESVGLYQGSSPSASFDVNSLENGSNTRDRLSSMGNERLPGAVLLARERLLQRLRGVSLSGSRRNNRIPSSIYHSDLVVGDDYSFADVGDWVTGTSTGSMLRDTSKRPPGLRKEALNRLLVEIFSNVDEEKLSRASQECSICLESFIEGDKLVRLPCSHRFHHDCLDPWVRICACCPYCRKDVAVTITKP